MWECNRGKKDCKKLDRSILGMCVWARERERERSILAFFKPHSSLLFASLKSVVFPTAPGSNSKVTLQFFFFPNENTIICHFNNKCNSGEELGFVLCVCVSVFRIISHSSHPSPLSWKSCAIPRIPAEINKYTAMQCALPINTNRKLPLNL